MKPSQTEAYELNPEDVVTLAERKGLDIIAYTYTEPLTYLEYVVDTAKAAHAKGMKNVLVTAGYVNAQPLADLLPWLDAANVDLKSFSDDIYRKVSGGSLKPVLNTILKMKEAGVWVELTHLLIPTVNDNPEMFRDMCRWIVGHGMADTPLHISRFFPLYKMSDLYPTPLKTMKEAELIAHTTGIQNVYLGNI